MAYTALNADFSLNPYRENILLEPMLLKKSAVPMHSTVIKQTNNFSQFLTDKKVSVFFFCNFSQKKRYLHVLFHMASINNLM